MAELEGFICPGILIGYRYQGENGLLLRGPFVVYIELPRGELLPPFLGFSIGYSF